MTKLSAKRLTRIDSFFNKAVADKTLAGAVTLIATDNEIRHFASYGHLDVENTIPMTNDVLVPIASMTKLFTAIAVMMLYEEGRFFLNDPIEKYIPEFSAIRVFTGTDNTTTEPAKTPPTIRDFLRHTSGMVYTIGNTPADKLYLDAGFRTWDKPLNEFVKKVASIPLAFHPGNNWVYSYSYDILGYFVEVISGKPLDVFCSERIFTPLELKNTGFFVPREQTNLLPNFYTYSNGTLAIDDDRNNSIYTKKPTAISGGGGWWSAHGGVVTTVSDFLIAAQVLLNYGQFDGVRLLSRKSVELMITNHVGAMAGAGKGYGLGVGIITYPGDHGELSSANQIYWAGAPYNTYFFIDYLEKLIGILFTNTAPFGHLEMMDKFNLLTMQSIDD